MRTRAGAATVWLATPVALVADEPVSELARFVGLVDTANGIAVRRSPRGWMFPNVDLTTHLHRQPAGRWEGLATTVVFGPDGAGLTTTVLHDLTGPAGRAGQPLTVRPLTRRRPRTRERCGGGASGPPGRSLWP